MQYRTTIDPHGVLLFSCWLGINSGFYTTGEGVCYLNHLVIGQDVLKFTYSRVTNTPGRQQSKTLLLSRNVDQKSLDTEFSIAICLATNGNKIKTLF